MAPRGKGKAGGKPPNGIGISNVPTKLCDGAYDEIKGLFPSKPTRHVDVLEFGYSVAYCKDHKDMRMQQDIARFPFLTALLEQSMLRFDQRPPSLRGYLNVVVSRWNAGGDRKMDVDTLGMFGDQAWGCILDCGESKGLVFKNAGRDYSLPEVKGLVYRRSDQARHEWNYQPPAKQGFRICAMWRFFRGSHVHWLMMEDTARDKWVRYFVAVLRPFCSKRVVQDFLSGVEQPNSRLFRGPKDCCGPRLGIEGSGRVLKHAPPAADPPTPEVGKVAKRLRELEQGLEDKSRKSDAGCDLLCALLSIWDVCWDSSSASRPQVQDGKNTGPSRHRDESRSNGAARQTEARILETLRMYHAYDCGQQVGRLSVSEDEEVEVSIHSSRGWSWGRCGKRCGWFPLSFTVCVSWSCAQCEEKCEPSLEACSSCGAGPPDQRAWPCGECRRLNAPQQPHCVACHTSYWDSRSKNARQ
mmetsp:Transcript_30059/g.68029  ORF Transcript_30059/g.68029 Transcript_30059/m.68029 type:complete len:469 (+) Transcript_30059:31-1437(+)